MSDESITRAIRSLISRPDPAGPATSAVDVHAERSTGAPSLDPLAVRDLDAQSPVPKLTSSIEPPQIHVTPSTQISDVDVKTKKREISSATYIAHFGYIRLSRPPRLTISTYLPSSRMMFTLLHYMSMEMMHHFYLKRAVPQYHPIYLRLYVSQLFYIQVLRCMNYAGISSPRQRLFVDQFLEEFRPETLPIPGPLVNFFKAICVFSPEYASYGLVSPKLYETLGNNDGLNTSLTVETSSPFVLPQVPLIMWYASWLRNPANGLQNGTGPYGFSPLTTANENADDLAAAINIGNVPFLQHKANWPDRNAWALRSPGLEYSIEQDQSLLDSLRAYRQSVALPVFDNGASRQYINQFLCLDGNRSYFRHLSSMVNALTDFWPGSGTLADISVHGISTGYVLSTAQPDPTTDNTAFVKPLDLGNLYYTGDHSWLQTVHTSTSLGLPPVTEILATATQTNLAVPNHPYYRNIGTYDPDNPDFFRTGPFWAIRPIIAKSLIDNQFQKLSTIASEMILKGNAAGRNTSAALGNMETAGIL